MYLVQAVANGAERRAEERPAKAPRSARVPKISSSSFFFSSSNSFFFSSSSGGVRFLRVSSRTFHLPRAGCFASDSAVLRATSRACFSALDRPASRVYNTPSKCMRTRGSRMIDASFM